MTPDMIRQDSQMTHDDVAFANKLDALTGEFAAELFQARKKFPPKVFYKP